MDSQVPLEPDIDAALTYLFALVCEALAAGTHALLTGEVQVAEKVIADDKIIDERARSTELMVWRRIEEGSPTPAELRRHLVTLLVLPEIERSADLAEHIAQRALTGLGELMSPAARGIVQQMSTVALEMWRRVADAFRAGTEEAVSLDEADEELDILRDRLVSEVATGTLPPASVGQVTLLARFYERLGDHAVNLARRVVLPATGPGT